MGHTAPPLRWYHGVGLVVVAGIWSGGEVGTFLGGLLGMFILFMIVRTFAHAAYGALMAEPSE